MYLSDILYCKNGKVDLQEALSCCEVLAYKGTDQNTKIIIKQHKGKKEIEEMWWEIIKDFFPEHIFYDGDHIYTMGREGGRGYSLALGALIRLYHRTISSKHPHMQIEGKKLKLPFDFYQYTKEKYFTDDVNENWKWFLATYITLLQPYLGITGTPSETFALARPFRRDARRDPQNLISPVFYSLKAVRRNLNEEVTNTFGVYQSKQRTVKINQLYDNDTFCDMEAFEKLYPQKFEEKHVSFTFLQFLNYIFSKGYVSIPLEKRLLINYNFLTRNNLIQ
jgi:hypothetical protein